MQLNKNNILSYPILLIAGGLSALAFAPYNKIIFLVISIFTLMWHMQFWLDHPGNKVLIKSGFCYFFGFFIAQLYWVFNSLYSIIGSSFIVALVAVIACNLYLAAYMVFALWLFKKLATKTEEFNYLFLLPSVWVIGEWLKSWLIAGFSWCDVAYTQISNFLLNGFFPLLGSYGVSWLCISVLGFLFLVITNHKILLSSNPSISVGQRLAIVYFVIIVIIGYSVHGKEYTKPYGKPVSIGLVQGNVSETEKWNSSNIVANLGMYEQLVAQVKADIVLLPETAFVVFEKYLPAHFMDDLVNFAKGNHSELVIGMPVIIDAKENYVNALVLVTNPKHPYYAKHHLVPYGEYIPFPEILGKIYALANLPLVGFSAGIANPEPLVMANQKVAFNLCYENGFGSELIKSASQATLMINASDMVWYGNTSAKDEHLQLSQARALENQRYFVQETNTGLTAVIDPEGRVQASIPAFQRTILKDYVVGRIGVTPYQRFGNYPIILLCCLFIAIAMQMKKFSKKL